MAGPLAVTAVVLALLTGLGAAAVPDVRGRSSTGPAAVVDQSGPAAAVPSPAPAAAPARGWRWPLVPATGGPPPVVGRFRVGPHRWSPGHRGADLAGGAGAVVCSAAAGVVTFVGQVAGTPVVVVTHVGGIRTTYQPVAATVRRGRTVATGEPIGLLQASTGHCPDGPCLHWGALRGDTYLDPLLLVERRSPPVLLPVDR